MPVVVLSLGGNEDIGRNLSHNLTFFFHEYERRVGMVPRSSLKEGKNSQMVKKGTKTTQQNQKPNKGQVSTIL